MFNLFLLYLIFVLQEGGMEEENKEEIPVSDEHMYHRVASIYAQCYVVKNLFLI